MPVEPRLASTVILLRERILEPDSDDNCEFEVFMVKRHSQAKFMKKHHVFPGGGIDKQDITKQSKEIIVGLDNSVLDKLKNVYDNPSILWIIAIRELFEETGILIASDKDGIYFDNIEGDLDRLRNYQKMLQMKQLTMTSILNNENLYYNANKLKYFGRFITPEPSPIRFDTQFFLCKFPPNQKVNLFKDELTEGSWGSPNDFMKKFKKGEIKLIFPQYFTLKRLRKYKTIKDLYESSKEVSSHNRLNDIKLHFA